MGNKYRSVNHKGLRNLLRDNPINDEDLIFEHNVNFLCEAIGQENFIHGVWFLTDYRCGLVSDKPQNDGYYYHDWRTVRQLEYNNDEKKIAISFINDDATYDIAKDLIFVVSSDNFDEVMDKYLVLYQLRYNQPIPFIIDELGEIFNNIQKGGKSLDIALSQIEKLLAVDPICGVIDIIYARTLESLDRGHEAATFLSKTWQITSIVAPHVILLEFFKYRWHKGALRFLPELPDDNSKDKHERLNHFLIQASRAKASEDGKCLVKYLVSAFMEIYENESDFNISWWLFFLIQLAPLVRKETEASIKDVAVFISDRLEKSLSEIDQTEGDLEGLWAIRMFKDIFNQYTSKPELTDITLLYNIISKFPESDLENDVEALLSREEYNSIATLEFKSSYEDLPETWTTEDVLNLTDDAWKKGSGEAKIKTQIARLFAYCRLRTRDPKSLFEELNGIKNGDNFNLLDTGNQDILWLTYLLEAELKILLDKKREVFKVLDEGRKRIKLFIGTYPNPMLRYAVEIIRFYESWALDSEYGIVDALSHIPRKAMLTWIHEVGGDAIKQIRNSKQYLVSVEEVTHKIESVISTMGKLITSDRISAEKMGDLIKGQNSIRNKLQDHEIRIAIGGETSAGKTTFLNNLFGTELFFVTPEEATGVPTEIRYAPDMRVDIIDEGGKVINNLQVDSSWLESDRCRIKDKFLPQMQNFIETFTKVGSSKLADHVKVYLPIDNFHPDLVIIDTPGFNANQGRSEIASKVIRNSHACLFLIDARNALKSGEMEVLNATHQEVGKTYFILNKMDLVLGDDELDCDEDAAKEIIERVERVLAKYFNVKDVQIHPVSSLPLSQIPIGMHETVRPYTAHFETLKEKILHEAIGQRLDLIIDSAAKEAIRLSEAIFSQIRAISDEFQRKEDQLNAAKPIDIKLFEEEIFIRLQHLLFNARSDYIDIINEAINKEFDGAIEGYINWLNSVTSKDTLKNVAQNKAKSLTQGAVKRIDEIRQSELKKLGKGIYQELINIFRDLYNELPFEASFDQHRLDRSVQKLRMVSQVLDKNSNGFEGGEFGALGGGAAGALIGTLIAPGIGTVIGAWLGSSIFGKSIDTMKQEIFESYKNGISMLYDKIVQQLDNDIDTDRSSSFLNELGSNIDTNVIDYRVLVEEKINDNRNEWNQMFDELVELKITAMTLSEDVNDLVLWRKERQQF